MLCLLQNGVLPMGSPSLKNLSHRLQILTESMFLHRVSTENNFLPSIHHNMVTFVACRVRIWFGVVLFTGCSGTTCLTTVFSMGCRHLEHILPLLLHWPWCLQDFSSHIFRISLLYSSRPVFFAPFLKYVITEMPPKLMIGSTLTSGISVLEPPEAAFLTHRGRSWSLSTTTTFAALLLQKSCHISQIKSAWNVVLELSS